MTTAMDFPKGKESPKSGNENKQKTFWPESLTGY